ncbi:DUF5691 domain-containing protein [Leptolyngbya sp. FACHB-261]|uniref:DUF5691 domain-containing protein n=1 Tax=Leptolyngbya sp. FACHB-261 TaxID=2692806 RepID=UPI0016861FE5|nr:DUF5691 domain-containing protein [Leptolyngbya sp. FACHB-261]MBD2101897.1 hypothetical protein [Leptolyngbya sp. FACHB-261]
MGLWQEIISVALVGTERQSLSLAGADAALGDFLSHLEAKESAPQLLSAAAVVAHWQRAGQLPMSAPPALLEPCEREELPHCSSRAGQYLTLMLQGQYKELIPEWLARVAAAGQRVPEQHLPELLELGRTRPELHELIPNVLGKRGHWLAAQNPDWNYAVAGDDETLWQTGSRAARLLILERLRLAEPELARERLITTWSQELADDRAAFLGTLRAGLSLADEPFLEQVLDERGKQVRRIATDLLARLPESQLCQRMAERVLPLLQLTPEPRLEVSLPEACDKAMIRDGIEPQPLHSSLGKKAGWLRQMLAATVLSRLEVNLNATPAQLVQAANAGEWAQALLEGWVTAAERQQNQVWAETLLREWLSGRTPGIAVEGLMAVLPPATREAVLLPLLQRDGGQQPNKRSIALLIQGCQHAWSPELSRIYLRISADSTNAELFSWLAQSRTQIIRCLDPALLEEAATAWAPTDQTRPAWWQRHLDEALALLQFRHDLIKEITP